jgi:hypothetical protein
MVTSERDQPAPFESGIEQKKGLRAANPEGAEAEKGLRSNLAKADADDACVLPSHHAQRSKKQQMNAPNRRATFNHALGRTSF